MAGKLAASTRLVGMKTKLRVYTLDSNQETKSKQDDKARKDTIII